jgi:hypothetical protein
MHQFAVAAVESHRRHLGVVGLIRDRITAAGHLAITPLDCVIAGFVQASLFAISSCVSRRVVVCLRVLYPQELHARWRNQYLTECMHPVCGLLVRSDAAFTELIKLVETLDLDFELQRWPALAAREGHEHARLQRYATGGLNFAANEVNRALTVGRQYRIGESSDIHAEPYLCNAGARKARSGGQRQYTPADSPQRNLTFHNQSGAQR